MDWKKDPNDPEVGIIAQDIHSLDLSSYGAAQPTVAIDSISGYGADTITIDSSNMYSSGTITLPTTTISNLNGGYYVTAGGTGGSGAAGSTLSYSGAGNNYAWTNTTTSPTVNITSNGIDMAAGTDITVAGKSLKEFMTKMEERLAILVPDPAKLEKFAALKKAYEHYKLMEKLCQELPKEED
jgi:hypothetical protein